MPRGFEEEALSIVRDGVVSATADTALRATADVFLETLPHWCYVGDTLLHIAAAAINPQVVGYLLANGADVAAVNRKRATPLHYACDPRPNRGVWNPAGQREAIARLLDAGAEISARDAGGVTPLHRAVRARSSEAVAALLERGGDPLLKDRRGSSAVDRALTSTGAAGTAGAEEEGAAIRSLLAPWM